ncbi:MAG: hypothetical protein HYV09_28270 [Deltaproteobacteria bacterium]|nr:hypothetical protein [Deltaproteobacteria bacterium]
MTIYDKAKYHEDSCAEAGLPYRQAMNHSGLFVAWLVHHGLLADEVSKDMVRAVRARKKPASTILEWYDGCLADDMLNEEGRAFTARYFDFDRGEYLKDFERVLARGAESTFHVAESWHNYDLIAPTIEARYRRFKGEDVPLPPPPEAKPETVGPTWWSRLSHRLFGRTDDE